MNAREVNVLLTRAAMLDPRMKRVNPEEQMEMALAWAEVLTAVPLQAGLDAVAAHYSRETQRALMPADVLAFAGVEVVSRDAVPSIDDGYMESRKAQALAAAGVSEAEYAAHEHDVPWLRSRFGAALQLGPLVTYDEDGEPE